MRQVDDHRTRRSIVSHARRDRARVTEVRYVNTFVPKGMYEGSRQKLLRTPVLPLTSHGESPLIVSRALRLRKPASAEAAVAARSPQSAKEHALRHKPMSASPGLTQAWSLSSASRCYACHMSKASLESFSFRGLSSLKDVDLHLSPGVTLLIGANGAGKSNLVNSIELLSRIMTGGLQDEVLRRGGANSLLYVAPRGEPSPTSAVLEVWGTPDDQGTKNGYQAAITPGVDDRALLREKLYVHDTEKYSEPYDQVLPLGLESAVATQAPNTKLGRFAAHVRPLLQGIRVYHFDDVSDNSPPKLLAEVGDNVSLRADAGNVAPYLMRLRESSPDAYARIVRSLQNVAPFFDDFLLQPEAGRVRLRWKQKGTDRVFMPSELSDGTLRFICLATLLLSPDRPHMIVLDEPELGLHPYAIAQLGALLRQTVAGPDGRQAVVATQSTQLLEEFPLESVVLVDRHEGATTLSRPNPETLETSLGTYSLGDMWNMNLLGGGRPVPELLPAAPRRQVLQAHRTTS